ncbi:hypothetical protein XIS1_280004 [Xenorhabdus innexi]|uniref:Transposase n=1 Tax=Xenorhabdus innexi TaxID=290109 RepID=A0A1N6MXQ3_9GAMM|nr:transposase [Xenorhabdus innexi]SIP73499.1 hypothetical protein XIS1_280004 [Xenorhabdus innexi]
MKRKSPQKFTDDFKKEAVNLIVEQHYTVPQAADALGIPQKAAVYVAQTGYRAGSTRCLNVRGTPGVIAAS